VYHSKGRLQHSKYNVGYDIDNNMTEQSLNIVRDGNHHVLVNLSIAVNAAVIFPTLTVAFVEEWK
jgi:hypothetical protein